jgi:hypothetical protein
MHRTILYIVAASVYLNLVGTVGRVIGYQGEKTTIERKKEIKTWDPSTVCEGHEHDHRSEWPMHNGEQKQ